MKRIVRPDLIRLAVDRGDGVPTIELSEDGALAKLKRVLVRGVPDNGYVIDLDAASCSHGGVTHRFPQFSAHFDRTSGAINKICDAALVWDVEPIKVALVDMKSEKPKLADAKLQLENSRKFLEYVHALLVWRDGELRRFSASLHLIMLDGSKARVGGRIPAIDFRDYVGIHGVTVNRSGSASVRWQDFFP